MSVLRSATRRFKVQAVLLSEDGSVVPVAVALRDHSAWHKRYRDEWTAGEGMEAIGHGGLMIEVFGLLWFLSPPDQLLSNVVYWHYGVLDVLRGAKSATVAAWEESTMTVTRRGEELVFQEVEPATGFVFFPERRLQADEFLTQLVEQSGGAVAFARAVIRDCEVAGGPRDFRKALESSLLGGLEESLSSLRGMNE